MKWPKKALPRTGRVRPTRVLPVMESMMHDLHYTLRTLRKDSGFAAFAILIIALGIGASSTVFSVLDALLVKALPFKDPGRLVWIANRTKIDGDLSGATLQVGRFLDFRQRNTSFADVAGYFAFYGVGDSKLTGNGEPERLSTVPVSQNFFPLLGVQPQVGRQFSADECKWNGPHVVMLSHGLWERRFGSDPDIAGKTIRLDDADATVVGVLPASFDFAAIFAPGTHIDLFAPFPLTKETDQWGNTLAVVGRLKPGARIGPAQAEANVLGAQITRENPHRNGLDPKLTFLPEHVSGRTRPALAVLACATGLVLGIAPALQTTSVSLSVSLGQRGVSGGKGQMWARAALVVSEIAFACVLLVGAGLLIRSFRRVLEVDPGFRPENAAAWRVDPGSQYKTQAQQNAYFDELLQSARTISGVQAAGLTDVLPLGHNRAWGAGAKGQTYKDDEYPSAFVRVVSDGYVKAMGMTLKKGRDFTERDTVTGATPVIMINETLARRLWPGQDPIGKSIVGDCVNGDRQVVGVVRDVRHVALEENSGSEMYMPIRQCQDWGSVDLVVRSTLPLPVLSERVEAALRPLIPSLPKGSMRPLTRLVDHAISPRRFIVLLLTGFATFALVLVSLGIYGVVSSSVTRRTQEIGIRMALGAQGARVQRQIVMETLGRATIGLAIGTVAAAVASHAISGLLFGVTYGDPYTFLAAAAVMLAVAGLAGYLPARRASRIDRPHAASPPGSSRRAGGYSPVLCLTADEMSLPYCPVPKSSPSGTRLYCR